MLGKRQKTHRRVQVRSAGAIVATAAALGGFASFAAPGMASDTIKVGVGESSIVVNGTTISTSNLTIAQLAKLQGVPAATVQLELDGVAANTPAAAAVEALIAGLPLETTLASGAQRAVGRDRRPGQPASGAAPDHRRRRNARSCRRQRRQWRQRLRRRRRRQRRGRGRASGHAGRDAGQEAPQPARRQTLAEGTSRQAGARAVHHLLGGEAELQRAQARQRLAQRQARSELADGQAAAQARQLPAGAQGGRRRRPDRTDDGRAARRRRQARQEGPPLAHRPSASSRDASRVAAAAARACRLGCGAR